MDEGGALGASITVSKRNRRNSFASIAAIARAMIAAVDATPVVPVLLQWQAHGDVIRSIQVIAQHEPPALMTAAADGTVRLWDMYTGAPLGNLVPAETLGAAAADAAKRHSAPAAGSAVAASAIRPSSPSREPGARPGASIAGGLPAAAGTEDATLHIKLPWRFSLDISAEAAALQAEANALLLKVQAAEAEAAFRALARKERQAKLRQEMAAAGKSLGLTSPGSFRTGTGTTIVGGGAGHLGEPGRPSSGFGGAPARARLPSSGVSVSASEAPAVDEDDGAPPVPLLPRPGISLGNLLSAQESRLAVLALGHAASSSVLQAASTASAIGAEGPDAMVSVNGAAGSTALMASASIQPAAPSEAAYVDRRKEALVVLRGLIESQALEDIPDEGEEGDGIAEDGDKDSTAGSAADSDGHAAAASKTAASTVDDGSVLTLDFHGGPPEGVLDGLLDPGILEGPMKRVVKGAKASAGGGGKQTGGKLASSGVGGSRVALLPAELLLESLSNERKAGTLLAAHLARTGQKPLMERYEHAQREKGRTSAARAAFAGSSLSATHASTVVPIVTAAAMRVTAAQQLQLLQQQQGSDEHRPIAVSQRTVPGVSAGRAEGGRALGRTALGDSAVSRSESAAPVTRGAGLAAVRLRYTESGDIDLAPSSFLLTRLGVNGAWPSPRTGPIAASGSRSSLPGVNDGQPRHSGAPAHEVLQELSSLAERDVSRRKLKFAESAAGTLRSASSSSGPAAAAAGTDLQPVPTMPPLPLPVGSGRLAAGGNGGSRAGVYHLLPLLRISEDDSMHEGGETTGRADSTLAAQSGVISGMKAPALGSAGTATSKPLIPTHARSPEAPDSRVAGVLTSRGATSASSLLPVHFVAGNVTSRKGIPAGLPTLALEALSGALAAAEDRPDHCHTASGSATGVGVHGDTPVLQTMTSTARSASRLHGLGAASARSTQHGAASTARLPALDLSLADAVAKSSAQLTTVANLSNKGAQEALADPIGAQTSRKRGGTSGISVALVQSLVEASGSRYREAALGAVTSRQTGRASAAVGPGCSVPPERTPTGVKESPPGRKQLPPLGTPTD
jgi:hypothetical protein